MHLDLSFTFIFFLSSHSTCNVSRNSHLWLFWLKIYRRTHMAHWGVTYEHAKKPQKLLQQKAVMVRFLNEQRKWWIGDVGSGNWQRVWTFKPLSCCDLRDGLLLPFIPLRGRIPNVLVPYSRKCLYPVNLVNGASYISSHFFASVVGSVWFNQIHRNRAVCVCVHWKRTVRNWMWNIFGGFKLRKR